MNVEPRIVLPATGAAYESVELCSASGGNFVQGMIEIGEFKDGETHVKLDRKQIHGQSVVVVGNFDTAKGVLVARDIAYCARTQGAREITVLGMCSNKLEPAITVPTFLCPDFSKRLEILDLVFSDLRESTQLLLLDMHPKSEITLYHFNRYDPLHKFLGMVVGELQAALLKSQNLWSTKCLYHPPKSFWKIPLQFDDIPAVFGMPGHENLAESVANSLDLLCFTDDCPNYKDFPLVVSDTDMIIIGGTQTEQATLDLFSMCWHMAEIGAHSITIYLTYFAYSTQERGKPGECVTAKSRAELLSTMPKLPGGVRIALFDLHSEGIPHYFREADVCADHIYLEPLVLDALRGIQQATQTGLHSGHMTKNVLSSVDGGRLKWVQTFADILNWLVVTVLKHRIGDGEVERAGFVGGEHIRGSHVFIYDDMIRTGRSLAEAVKQIEALKPLSISVVCSHGVLPGEALSKLKALGRCDRVITFDTHPRAVELAFDPENHGFLVVYSIAPLIVKDILDCSLVKTE